jgi:hypothetical protein
MIGYKVNDFAIPFTVVHCPTEAAAKHRLLASPAEWRAQRNGSLIIDFPMWGDDGRLLASRISEAFLAFKAP